MSKADSGLFSRTKGSAYKSIVSLMHSNDEPTAIVWKHIATTQDNYSGTVIPKSFEVDVPITSASPDGKLWTHANATEHMYEAVSTIKKTAPKIIINNPNLYSQFILYDYYKSVGKALNSGIKYGKATKVGNWEFIIVPARAGQKYPVVKHALFVGLE